MRFRSRRGRRVYRSSKTLSAAFMGGVVAGLIVWSIQMTRSRRDLFSGSPIRRLAAIGYLGGQPGVETAQILTEYLRWETTPALRKRAERVLSRMQRYLV